jgi:peroxiredoxin
MELRPFALALTLTLTLALLVGGCASASSVATQVPATPLVATAGTTRDVRDVVASAPLTVLIFFSRDCHCLDQHDARIRELYEAYHPRGVQVVMVDPEVRASPDIDAAEAARRGYVFPILIDPKAHLADALGAEYATYSVIVDAEGRIRYRGGFDSDKTHLRESATPYVRDALDDLLAGRPPRLAEAKTLGCALEKW